MREIDLHKMNTIPDALEQLEHELFLVYTRKEMQCRVIHGIGEGKLSAAVHEALSRNPMVRQWQEEDHGGSCLITL